MTATTNKSQAIAEWTKIFPRQVTENYTSSVTFMKQLTVIAVSTITYLKNAFPEDNYTVDTYDGLKIRILKKNCKDELPQFLSTSLTQAYDAFDKKYLYQIALCFYEDECKLENLLEYHVFEYTYTDGGVSMSINSKNRGGGPTSVKCTFESIKEKTAQLIRACIVMMQTYHHQLPECYDVSLRLYYNDDAPDGYQAPGYLAAKDSEDPVTSKFQDSVKLGWVETPYHKLVLRTYVKDDVGASREAIPSLNPPIMSQAPEDFTVSQDPVQAWGRRSAMAGSDAVPLRCACNNYEPEDPPAALLVCQYCNTGQHAACYGLGGSQATRVARHCCVRCSDADPARTPTDPRLAAVRKRDCFAIFRRALWWLRARRGVAPHELRARFGLTAVSASKLMKLLHNHAVIRQDHDSDQTTPATINHEYLKSVMEQYFQPSEEDDLVNRLVAESIASQETPDPLAEVLSPMEKVSLHKASNLGRVIQPEENNNVTEDSTLKQYREALVLVEKMDDELPLSGSHNPVDIEKLGKGKRKIHKTEKGKTGVKTKRARITRQ